MHFLTSIIISLSALAAAAPMPAGDDGIFTTQVIPTECADLKDVYMECVASPTNPKEGTKQCNYTDANGKLASKATDIKCTPTVKGTGSKTLGSS
ncbi:hypothetical protein MCOR25_006575 [Pyricularia grisea]|uniref:Uncharacterized protein n=1 Tax=Pyricularia grisea TaxID=148305 RepID=A0A6P8B3M0_PYRGI|nr:uncharacterized protein PgNI_07097 [Pyricularia grisea]KAI6360925.1 hypothetical protein MCOR25_006575 [Pyricularia grisea]TLD09414.1 hypothetical protein PgNI_07097 [Pyricularia grisea]